MFSYYQFSTEMKNNIPKYNFFFFLGFLYNANDKDKNKGTSTKKPSFRSQGTFFQIRL